MKRFIRGRYIIGVIACCTILFWAGLKTSALFTPSKLDFQFSGSFCLGQKVKIKDFFSGQRKEKAQPLRDLCAAVQKQFPSIESISLSHIPSGVLIVNIKSMRPLFAINQDFVLTDVGSLFNKLIFSSDSLKKLRQITCCSLDLYKQEMLFGNVQTDYADRLPDNFLQTAKNIPAQRFDLYDIVCESSIKWLLQDRQKKNFSILCTNANLSDERLITACNKVKGTLCERDNRFLRGIRSWVTDVRFENQIILSRKTGGR